MAENHTSTASNDRLSLKGKDPMPIPTLCRTKMLPNKVGWCERTEQVIETELLKRLKKKENVIVELTNRILEWNDTKCPECYASLKGEGPQVLDEHAMKNYENGDLSDDEFESAAHIKNTEDSNLPDAATSLRKILGKK